MPLSQLEERLPAVVKNKALPVVLVCASGARSNRAVAIAKKLGYEQRPVARWWPEGLARSQPACGKSLIRPQLLGPR